MRLENRDIITLAKKVAGAKSIASTFNFNGEDYSVGAANEALREQFRLLAGDYNSYRRNKNDIFEIMQEVIDTVLPKRIMESYGQFAEIKTYAQGDKPSFVRKTGRARAKQFITRVGLAGIYEVFKLDKKTFDIETTAYGGAAQIGLEEFLDGTIDFNEMIDIILEGLDEAVYREIAIALRAAVNNLQSANQATGAGLVEANFDPLLTVVRAYGEPTIYATLETAAKIVPSDAWISDEMRNTRNAQGLVGVYKGVKVVVLPQSFTDETNQEKIIDDSLVYIIPSGANGKPIKVAMEGSTIVDEYENRDRSREIQAYKKFGVACVVDNDIAVYTMTSEIPDDPGTGGDDSGTGGDDSDTGEDD